MISRQLLPAFLFLSGKKEMEFLMETLHSFSQFHQLINNGVISVFPCSYFLIGAAGLLQALQLLSFTWLMMPANVIHGLHGKAQIKYPISRITTGTTWYLFTMLQLQH